MGVEIGIIYIKYRPSTPMRLVMGNSYGLEAENIILDRYSRRAGS